MPRPADDDDYDRPSRRRDWDDDSSPRRRGREDDYDSRRRDDDDYDPPRRRGRDDADDYDRPPPRKSSSKALFIILGVVFVLMLACGGAGVYGLITMRESANRMKSSNNLKQIGLAIHNFNDSYGGLPGNTADADGKPLLSWRVHILPFIEQDNLYRQFKLDEPWDGPTNKRLLDQMPRTYAHPAAPASTRLTHYRGFGNPGAAFGTKVTQPENRGIRPGLMMGAVSDGLPNTVLVVEAADPIEWTRPDDLDASPGKPFPGMGGEWSGKKFNLLLGDGSVRNIRRDTPEDILRSLTTVRGNDPLPAGWDTK